MDDDELYVYAKEIRAPVELVRQTKHLGRLPVVNFAAGTYNWASYAFYARVMVEF